MTKETNKGDEIKRLLARKRGAKLDELIAVTGWKRESVMSRLSWLKKHGHKIERVDGERFHMSEAS